MCGRMYKCMYVQREGKEGKGREGKDDPRKRKGTERRTRKRKRKIAGRKRKEDHLKGEKMDDENAPRKKKERKRRKKKVKDVFFFFSFCKQFFLGQYLPTEIKILSLGGKINYFILLSTCIFFYFI